MKRSTNVVSLSRTELERMSRTINDQAARIEQLEAMLCAMTGLTDWQREGYTVDDYEAFRVQVCGDIIDHATTLTDDEATRAAGLQQADALKTIGEALQERGIDIEDGE